MNDVTYEVYESASLNKLVVMVWYLEDTDEDGPEVHNKIYAYAPGAGLLAAFLDCGVPFNARAMVQLHTNPGDLNLIAIDDGVVQAVYPGSMTALGRLEFNPTTTWGKLPAHYLDRTTEDLF